MLVSIIIRTYNEERHLRQLLTKIFVQSLATSEIEIILVDSGSNDKTLEIAESFPVRIVNIAKSEFTFGRSLNIGCECAQGKILVFISGHCIPLNQHWLSNLVQPLLSKNVVYVYGKQVGNEKSRFSEIQLFKKYYQNRNIIPQEEVFCNNANSALLRNTWQLNKFCEEITGLEDMDLCSRLIKQNEKIAYIADAVVYHLHDETWKQIKNRYERESFALQHIMPQIHISFLDFVRYFFSAVLLDSGAALHEKKLIKFFGEIVLFRLMQFWGSYKGNHIHRKLSSRMKEKYFFPK